MLTLQSAATVRARKRRSKLGLALAGGGPVGGIYEIGALLALDEALDGVRMEELDIYVGVSSGGLIAAALANGIDVPSLCRMFIRNESLELMFAPEEVFFKPAFMEYLRRAVSVPERLAHWMFRFLAHPINTKISESITSLGPAIPTGIFNNEAIREFFIEFFSDSGKSDDFRKLNAKLFLVAVDLNTAEPVVFGSPGFDHIPISKALQASAALPGLYSPVEIEGNHYVDGALRKTMHASAALEQGTDLLFCINPIVPFDARLKGPRISSKHKNLLEGGLPVVLSQTFRTLVYSRMVVGMRKYQHDYPKADVALFMPDRDDPKMFFTNVFSYANRRRVCEHAYQTTRQDLLANLEELEPVFARHKIHVSRDVLEDSSRHYWLADSQLAEA